MTNIEIRQIFYNSETFNKIKAPAIPLDNTTGDKSWFEFLPIVKFLFNTKLDPSGYYGFFSPKFESKTRYSINDVINLINKNKNYDVYLFTPDWDHLAYFKNPWEQGEIHHPGLTKESQKFLNHFGIDIDLNNFVTCCKNSVYSNFIVANSKYWNRWTKLALDFFNYSELSFNNLAQKKTKHADYASCTLKVFIQERLHSILLNDNKLKILNFYKNDNLPSGSFLNTSENIKNIELCNLYKERFIFNGEDKKFIVNYENVKRKVLLKKVNFKKNKQNSLTNKLLNFIKLKFL